MSITVELTVLYLPSTLARLAGNGAWLAVPLGLGPPVVVAFLSHAVARRFPQETVADYAPRLLGPWLGRALVATMLLSLTWTLALVARTTGELVKTLLLERTPLEVVLLVLLLPAAEMARRGLEPVTRLSELLFPFMLLLPLPVFLLAFSINDFSLTRLLPLWQSPPSQLAQAGLVNALYFHCAGFLFFLYPALNNKARRRALPIMVWSMAFITLLNLAAVVLSLAAFGPKETARLTWPFLALVKVIDIPALFLERLDFLFISGWISTAYSSTYLLYYLITFGTSRLLDLKDHRVLAAPLLPLVLLLARVPDTFPRLLAQRQAAGLVCLLLALLAPLVLLAAYAIKGGQARAGS